MYYVQRTYTINANNQTINFLFFVKITLPEPLKNRSFRIYLKLNTLYPNGVPVDVFNFNVT